MHVSAPSGAMLAAAVAMVFVMHGPKLLLSLTVGVGGGVGCRPLNESLSLCGPIDEYFWRPLEVDDVFNTVIRG